MLLYANASHVVDSSVALAAHIHTYSAAHAPPCLPLTMAQATAVGRDSRGRVPFEQCGLEHKRRPAPRLANPHRSHVARMLAHPVPTTFRPYSRRAGRSSCCWPKSWPKLLFGSNLVQAHAATNSFMSGLPTSEMRPERLLTVPKSIAAAAAHARGHSGPLQLATALT